MSEQLVVLADVLVRSTPLILAGLAVVTAFKAGILNIGADGQLIAGATAAAAVGVSVGGTLGMLALPIALLCGAVAGGMWASIAAYLRARFGVLEVISTIMLNFVAIYGVSYLVRGPLQEPTHIYPQTSTIDATTQLPRLLSGTRLHAGVFIAVVLAVAIWWIFRKTALGFRVRVIGANPFAARSAGQINVDRVAIRAFIMSGALAGLAGAVEVSGVTYSLYENISPGYGYTAIAVALLAALNPLGVIATGILFGALEAGASALQRDAGIPATLAAVIEASIILIVIGVERFRFPWRKNIS
jgi:simple sugar transport system permease protein